MERVALQPDGSIGYVQPIGEKPDPTRKVDARSQAPFGTGAWLLAACERVRYLDGSVAGKGGRGVTVEISNPTDEERNDVVELDARPMFDRLGICGGRQFVVRDGDQTEVPYQLTHDGKILVQAFVRPRASTTLTFSKGTPSDFPFVACGRVFPSREDDLAWENDRNGWRAYGPAIQNSGQHIYGYDVFNKNVPVPMLETFYHSELTSYALQDRLRKAGWGSECDALHRTLTYHRDRGFGMDAYTVGATLGAGVPALVDGKGGFIYPLCYRQAEVLDNGPLRFSARLTFGGRQIGGEEVVERRIITLDKGCHLNRCEVVYEGLTTPQDVVAGIVVHKSAPKAYFMDKKAGYVAYADPMDHPEAMNGQIYIACLFPEGLKKAEYVPLSQEAAGGIGHVVGRCRYEPGRPFVYYFGSAWSKYDVPAFPVWKALLSRYAANLEKPLEVTVR